jgi:hypothetical protein
MARSGTFEEQWADLIKPKEELYRVRLWPLPAGTWRLRPRTHTFDPCQTLWGIVALPDPRLGEGISYRTFWFAFREPPYLHIDREHFDGEAICVNYEDILRDILVPGLRFQATVDAVNAVADVELLGITNRAERP